MLLIFSEGFNSATMVAILLIAFSWLAHKNFRSKVYFSSAALISFVVIYIYVVFGMYWKLVYVEPQIFLGMVICYTPFPLAITGLVFKRGAIGVGSKLS